MGKFVDLTGQKFGLLTVIERAGSDKSGGAKWLCVCDCEKKTVTTASSLKNGHTKTCGDPKHKVVGNEYTFFDDYCIGKDKNGNEFIIDIEDYDVVSQYSWHINKKGHWLTGVTINKKRTSLCLHNLLLPHPQNMVADHKDTNPSNNRRSNLRICTLAENSRNRSVPKTNTSGAKGVHWNKQMNKWQASLRYNGMHYHLGLFDTVKEASDAYDEAAIKYFGEFAKLNNYQEDN